MRSVSATRAIRVGVLLQGNLVEEKIFDGSIPITIGQSLRCALSLPVDALPSMHVLFARDDGRFLLRVTRSMQGRVGTAGTIAMLDTIRETPADAHGVWAVPLARGARGKLSIGEATILFQEVAAPVAAPRPQLPAAVRGTLADRIDPRLAMIIGGSLIAHLGLAIWAWATDVESAPLIPSTVASQYTQETVELTMPDPTPTTTVPADPTPTSTPVGVAKPISPTHAAVPSTTPHIANQMPDPAKLREDAIHMADLLTSFDTKPGGTPGDMNKRTPGADLKSQIDAAKDKHVSIGDPQRSRPDAAPRIGTTVGPQIQPTELTHVPEHHGEDPLPRLVLKPIKHDPGSTLTVDSVLTRISNLYMAGLQRCYAKGLSLDASLAGKVTIGFTVDDNGKVADATASGLTTLVNTCIDSQMAGWRFGIPKNPKTGEPTDAAFTVSLQLSK